ncbi:MAG: phage protease [Verrucomicrobiales bacterium]
MTASRIVTALDATLPSPGEMADIVYFPEGTHTITPSVDGKPKTITVKLEAKNGEKIAERFQDSLQKLLSENVRPIFDFDHKDTGPASGLPKRFFYEKGKGLMASVEWTGAGRKAIESKDYSYFSPTFLISDSGEPSGLPKRGPLGALVNSPAFREIPRIAAKDGTQPNPDQEETMSQLVTCGLLNESEAAKEDAVRVATARVTAMRGDSDKLKELEASIAALNSERDELKKKLSTAEDEAQKHKEAQAADKVKEAVAAGKIAAKDEEGQAFWKELVMEKGQSAVKALDALPAAHGDITSPVVKASFGDKTKGGGTDLLTEAKKLVTAKEAETEEEAIGMVAASNPELYQAYADSLGNE